MLRFTQRMRPQHPQEQWTVETAIRVLRALSDEFPNAYAVAVGNKYPVIAVNVNEEISESNVVLWEDPEEIIAVANVMLNDFFEEVEILGMGDSDGRMLAELIGHDALQAILVEEAAAQGVDELYWHNMPLSQVKDLVYDVLVGVR